MESKSVDNPLTLELITIILDIFLIVMLKGIVSGPRLGDLSNLSSLVKKFISVLNNPGCSSWVGLTGIRLKDKREGHHSYIIGHSKFIHALFFSVMMSRLL